VRDDLDVLLQAKSPQLGFQQAVHLVDPDELFIVISISTGAARRP